MKTPHLISLAAAAAAFASLPSHGRAQSFIDFGSAATYGVLAGTSVTSTGSTLVTGDLGVSPGATVVGFPAGVVTGTIHTNDPAAAQAQLDLLAAYNTVTGQTTTVSGTTAFANTTLLPDGTASKEIG